MIILCKGRRGTCVCPLLKWRCVIKESKFVVKIWTRATFQVKQYKSKMSTYISMLFNIQYKVLILKCICNGKNLWQCSGFPVQLVLLEYFRFTWWITFTYLCKQTQFCRCQTTKRRALLRYYEEENGLLWQWVYYPMRHREMPFWLNVFPPLWLHFLIHVVAGSEKKTKLIYSNVNKSHKTEKMKLSILLVICVG